ncbi:MAG: FAD-dependent oxidoreductase [Miltoncostaeaceae bacterium]
MRVAVVGSGIAGLGAALALGRVHEVEVFEADDRAGGHANTVKVPRLGGGELDLDTGFLVHNHANYPLLTRFFGELGVLTQESDMSFSVSCRRCDIEYSGRAWRQPGTLVRPGMARLMAEIARFLRTGTRALEQRHSRSTLGEFVAAEGYSRSFRDHFIVPFAAALWSTAPGPTLDFPAPYAVRFFQNHGLVGFRRNMWRTVTGGSRRYVEAVQRRLGERLHLSTPVTGLVRHPDGVTLRTGAGDEHRFDHVLLATHAPQALAILGDGADAVERDVLGPLGTTVNRTLLHTDTTLMPRRRSAWGSWNYLIEDCTSPGAMPTVTYHLNRLHSLDEPEDYCVTLNRQDSISPARTLAAFDYAHPLYTFAALDARERIPEIQGRNRTWFAGAWQGNGFHEDGLASGLRVAAALGAPW